MQLFSAPLAGFTQGVQPIISYNFGAGKFDRVKKKLPHFAGVMGIYYAEPIADILSAVTASTLFVLNIKKILSLEALEKVK